jgi:hypothetical protein
MNNANALLDLDSDTDARDCRRRGVRDFIAQLQNAALLCGLWIRAPDSPGILV